MFEHEGRASARPMRALHEAGAVCTVELGGEGRHAAPQPTWVPIMVAY
jgi:hypothetical protein